MFLTGAAFSVGFSRLRRNYSVDSNNEKGDREL